MRRLALVVLAVIVGAGIGRVATAANTVPAGTAGQGSSATSSYSISGVSYTLDVNNPRNVGTVSFTISPASARVVHVRLFNAGAWYSCTNTSGSVSCATSAPATSSNNLTVVASQ
jgi:hypothetical protein